MDGFQLTVIGKAVTDWQWQDDPARHERRGPDGNHIGDRVSSDRARSAVKLVIAACAGAAARLRADASPHVASTPLPAAEASSHG